MFKPNSHKIMGVVALASLIGLVFSAVVAAEGKNPSFFYFSEGKLVGDWRFQVGDPGNWGLNIDDLTGRSKNGKLEVMPDRYKADGDAIRGVWSRKKEKGELKLVASSKDLSAAKDVGALAFTLKMNKKPKGGVAVAIDCNWPCRAEVNISRQLRKKKTGEWFVFPVPLNCFQSDNFDLSKVNGFMIATDNKMDLSVADVSLIRMPEGDPGCAEEEAK